MFEPHITIKTKNGLTEDLSWIEKVRPVIESYHKFEVSFTGVDTFRDEVVILRIEPSKELVGLHKELFRTISPDETDTSRKYFENDRFEPHLTLGMSSWGMNKEELVVMKEAAEKEFPAIPKFEVPFVRIYRQKELDELYEEFLDIPLNE